MIHIPWFEAQQVVHNPGRMLINVVKEKLFRDEKSLPVLDENVREALEDYWQTIVPVKQVQH